ncbi:ABC transporter permease subunit [Paenibacillus sp. LMG 31458]|uniref:ABC transporter permease subunit n=1 Tax=Paenibacillus phytorum TaxID=2654977 RepID=A0ABX1Y4C6_9BACL|nr:carbohydrate ABC transporter permease [Paenibacillus phytorum]NOU75745.1 ABC transporter permease subunit [Paenibacillus phytorum]
MKIRNAIQDKAFDIFNYSFLTVILVIVLYPLYFVFIASFSEPDAIYRGDVIFRISGFNLKGYHRILENANIWLGYRNSILYLVIGTFVNLLVTIPAAYSLSRKDTPARKTIIGIFMFTMFFSGGLIPTFLLVKSIGLYNTFSVMVILGAVNVFNLMVAMSFFQSTISEELLDAAVIDGCSDIQFFFKIVIPLSKAIIAVMTLYYGVAHWNSFFNAIIYLKDKNLYPLQLILRDILTLNQVLAGMSDATDSAVEQQKIAESIKYGVIIVASLPMMVLYPFIQKHFVQGVMIGSVKG